MALLRRSRPGQALEQVQVEQATPKVGRLRTTTANTAATREAKAAEARRVIDEKLKLISEAESAIESAQAKIERLCVDVEEALRSANLISHSDGVYKAELKDIYSRQSRIIHPQKFRNHVSNDVFWKCISVQIGEATKFLSEKEIASISDHIPSKYQTTTLKVEKVERRRR